METIKETPLRTKSLVEPWKRLQVLVDALKKCLAKTFTTLSCLDSLIRKHRRRNDKKTIQKFRNQRI